MSAKRHAPPKARAATEPPPSPAFATTQQAARLFEAAVAHHQQGRLREACELYARSLELKPGVPEALSNLGCALKDLGRAQEALGLFDKAVAANPAFADAWSNRGNALLDLHRPQEALECFDKAIGIQPGHTAAWSNRACALLDLGRPPEALESSDRALALMPRFARAHSNRGNALMKLGRAEEAVQAYKAAVSLQPHYAEAFHNLGLALGSLGRHEEALESLDTALSQDPAYPFLPGECIHTRMKLALWDRFEALRERCVAGVERGLAVATPFTLTTVIDEPGVQRKAAEIFGARKFPARALAPLPVGEPGERIRIGYYSADFHNHATTYLMADLLERHDRSRFEVTGFSFGPDRPGDRMRQRAAAAMDRFLDVRLRTDREIAQLSREARIDLAIDLNGYTRNTRLGIFAHRCAPLQASYLAYPGTLALPYIDYLIADHTAIPQAQRGAYAESIAYLPHCYQPVSAPRNVSTRPVSRRQAGLPEDGFVFCCFNATHKILPAVFDAWMRILQAVPSGVLWLFEENAAAARNLRAQAQARGVQPGRIVFAPRAPSDEHLARHKLADLFLDTLPYNAHTTAADAIWMGLPLLTCMGHSFQARVAASLLRAAGVPDLIVESMADYETLAIALANEPSRLAAVRAKLQAHRTSAPFFDGALFARHLEKLYETMVARQRAGLPPGDVRVER